MTRRGHRTKYTVAFKPYEVEPISDLKGWVGLNKENCFLAFRDLLWSASREILIANYLIKTAIPGKNSLVNSLIGVLMSKILKGVEVKVLLNNHFPNPHLQSSTLTAHKALSKAGVNVRLYAGKSILHAKLIIVDNQKVYLGSHNLSNTSLAINEESGIIVYSEEIANFYREYFFNLWGVE